MFELLNDWIVAIADLALRPLLALPRDALVAILAVTTASIIVFVRPFTTNQDLLGRCKKDKKRLKELTREAKKAKDKEARGRYRITKSVIAMKMMKQEGKPLLVAIVPLLLIFPWGMARLGWHSPGSGDEVTLNVYFPKAGVGRIAYITPREGVEAASWIAQVERTPPPAPAGQEGKATWKMKAAARTEPYELVIHYEGEEHTVELLVGADIYARDAILFEAESKISAAELIMTEYRFAGLIPGFVIPRLFLPVQSWMIAYLLIAFPLVFILKGIFKIH